MRPHSLLAALFLVGAGCRESVTDPFHTVSGAAPSGLAVTFGIVAPSGRPLPGAPSITAAGDSVVVTAVLISGGCGQEIAASAGVVGGTLVVTSVSTFADPPQNCALVAYSSGPTVRAVVRPAPRGRYTVVVRERSQREARTSHYDEREITRRAVSLP